MANLFFHTAFLGDLLLSIPALRYIKKCWPQDKLILVVRPGLADFFMRHHLADHALELDKKSASSLRELEQSLSGLQINNVFCAHQSFRSALVMRKIRSNNKIAYSQWWNKPFFNIRVARTKNLPEVMRVLELVAPFDQHLAERLESYRQSGTYSAPYSRNSIDQWKHLLPPDLSAPVIPDELLVRSVLNKYNVKRPFVVVAPSSQWSTKRWPVEHYVELIHQISERGLNVYIVGAKSESTLCHEVATKAAAKATRIDVRTLAGETSLLELHALASVAEVTVANDSGPMHMAALTGRPVIGIFGPTTLDLGYRPWSDHSYIAQVDLSCRPCGSHGHNACPIKTHDCMKKINVDEVIRGVDLLRKSHPNASVINSSHVY